MGHVHSNIGVQAISPRSLGINYVIQVFFLDEG